MYKRQPQEGSYTCYLFDKGLDKILKKVGEECAETIIAAKNGRQEETVGEISDLIYHLTVMMAQQNIPLKYLESITTILSKKKLVEATSGKGGGYRLSRSPETYSVGEILRAVEESIEPVTCIENGVPVCETAESCSTLPIWKGLSAVINDYLNAITLADAAKL